jgi:hypothetical protein
MYGSSFKLDPGRLAADAGPECTAAASNLIQDVWQLMLVQDVWQLMQVQNVQQQLHAWSWTSGSWCRSRMYGSSFKLDQERPAADAGPECTAAALSLIQNVWQLLQVQNVRQQLQAWSKTSGSCYRSRMYGSSFKLNLGRLAADAGPECTAAASSLIMNVRQLMQVQNVWQQL